MIKEVAIEPEVMATWQHFRELWAGLGVGQGRLVAEYPPDWRDGVCRLAYKFSSAKAASIAARLKPPPGTGAAKRWITTTRPFDKGKDWLTNAEKHDGNPNGFDAIVARNNPRNKTKVVVAGDFPPDQTPWKVNRQIEVERSPAKLLECAKRLLEMSNDLVMVDSNFKHDEPRFQDPFEAFIRARPAGKWWNRCELHTEYPLTAAGLPDHGVVKNRIHNMGHRLSALIPEGCVLRVRFWYRKGNGKKLHPRFLLTEHGGIHYDYGLDAGDGPSDTTIVSLMEEDLWRTAWSDYGLDNAAQTAFATDANGDAQIVGIL